MSEIFACDFCGKEVESPRAKHTIADCAYHMKKRIAELEAKATADRKYMDEAEARIADLEAELAHAQERTAKKYSLWVKAETELDALKEPKRPEGPPNQYSKGWWMKTKPVNREGGEG